jgi:hypothetical protein
MKRHKTRYTVAELEQAVNRATDPIARYYLEAELRRRKNNGPKIRHDDEKHVKDRERKRI